MSAASCRWQPRRPSAIYRREGDGFTETAHGTGRGLAIVRAVAKRHGASVTLGDSPLGGLHVEVRFAAQG